MPAPRGVPQIEVSLDIDANGILSVTAQDKATGKQKNIRIEGGSQLSKDEIERMRREAEENAEADLKERETVDKLNEADSLIFQTEKQIKEFSDNLSEQNKTDLGSALDVLKKAHSEKNLSEIETAMSSLNDTWDKVSTEIYSKTESQSQEPVPDVQETQSEVVE
jgi:molecular chaperone DnaK